MQKSGRGKSERKPLVDISNGMKNKNNKPFSSSFTSSFRDPSAFKKIAAEEEKQHHQQQEDQRPHEDPNITSSDGDKEGYALDRLLLAHSDLSNLIHQIDEMIVQAVKLNATCKLGSQEIESFMCALSDMHSTLKPWLPRFQQALSRPSMESDIGQALPVPPESASNEGRTDVLKYSEEVDLDSIISPSPLVSWHGNCRVESGRQLFLLTPLPKVKGLSSKHPVPSKSVSEKVPNMGTPSCALSLPSLKTISGNFHDDLLDSVELKPTSMAVKSAFTMSERTSDCSPLMFSNQKNRDISMFLMTPLLKMSPPKTLGFLELVSESFHQNENDMIKPTPLDSGFEDRDGTSSSEKSSAHVSGSLASKYPDLFGIQLTHNSAIKRRDVEASLDWFFSPPKTCILMEPPEEKSLANPGGCDLFSNNDVCDEQTVNMVSALDKKVCSRYQLPKEPFNHGLCSTNLAAPESTPMLKDFESTVRKGKQPGETTLKRELWTRFDAVSTPNVLSFDVSLFPETKGKGFLDRLEEVSCVVEEIDLEPKTLL